MSAGHEPLIYEIKGLTLHEHQSVWSHLWWKCCINLTSSVEAYSCLGVGFESIYTNLKQMLSTHALS